MLQFFRVPFDTGSVSVAKFQSSRWVPWLAAGVLATGVTVGAVVGLSDDDVSTATSEAEQNSDVAVDGAQADGLSITGGDQAVTDEGSEADSDFDPDSVTATRTVDDGSLSPPDALAFVSIDPDANGFDSASDTGDVVAESLTGGDDNSASASTSPTSPTAVSPASPTAGNIDVVTTPTSVAVETTPTTTAPAAQSATVTTTTVSRAPNTTAAPAAASPTNQLPAPIGIPGGAVQMGFNVDLWGQDRTDYWNDLESVPGNGRLIAHEFKSFTRPISTDLYAWHLNEGRDLLLTWNGTDAGSILNGSYDEWIREHAQELSSLPGTVMLRFWHEPDVSHKQAWIDGDPQQFIDSWMYVRRIFVEEGAVDNIEWVWCPTAWNWAEQGARYYPGDANVDWICADGYSGWDLNAPLDPIQEAYTDFQAWADQHSNKPILIAEFGAGERSPGERAEWVAGIPSWVNASPNIRAVVYFDYDMRAHGEIYDWRLRTEPDAWQAMMDVLSSAPFS